MRDSAKRFGMGIYLVLVVSPLLYVLSAGPALHFSSFRSYAAVYRFYGPVLALDQREPLGRVFWKYMLLWRIYPGGAFGSITNAANESLETNCRGIHALVRSEGFGYPLHARRSRLAAVAQVTR
jgi:hypothetical protein